MSKMIIKIVLLTIFLIVIGFFISGPIFTNSEITDKIEQLSTVSAPNEGGINYSNSKFLSLPLIVRKYLKNSLGAKPELPKQTQLKLVGETRDGFGSDWEPTEVDFYYSNTSPEFVWVSTSEQFSFLWIKRINSLINNRATSQAKFLSSITTEETEGVKLDQTFFLFYLLNSVFTPTVLFPSQNMQWEKLEKYTAEVVIWYKSEHGKAIFYFNELGNVEKIVVEDMFMPNVIDSKKEKFTIHLANHVNKSGYNIPTYFEYQWNLSGGDFTFSRFNLISAKYK